MKYLNGVYTNFGTVLQRTKAITLNKLIETCCLGKPSNETPRKYLKNKQTGNWDLGPNLVQMAKKKVRKWSKKQGFV